MKNLQKWIIFLIILLPVVLGIVTLVTRQHNFGALPSPTSKRIGLIEITGVITESRDYIRQLKSFRQDNSIAGVLLRIDSPGGAVAPSQEIYREVARFKSEKKPVIITMGNVAASGGYYIASPGHTIFADPGTLTGSIGVILTIPFFKDLANKIGVRFRVFKAGKYKDMTTPYREMSPEEQKIIQDVLDDTHNQFINDVAIGREMDVDSIGELADGRIFTGRQAVTAGLVDTLGGFEEALDYLRKQSGVSERARVVRRFQKDSFFEDFLMEEILHILPPFRRVLDSGMYFLYAPYAQ